jgi:hypothetical protein
MSSATPCFFAACAGGAPQHLGAANDSNSPKVHRRERPLASVHTKPVSPTRYAADLSLLYLSDGVFSPFSPPHLAPGVCRYNSIALRLEKGFEFFGLPQTSFVASNEKLQQASA